MAKGRETGVLEGRDEARQDPEREGLGRREAILDLGEGEGGGEPVALPSLGALLGAREKGVLELPIAVLEARGVGVDAAHEMVVSLVKEDGDLLELAAVLRHSRGMDHRLAIGPPLAQPQPRRLHRQQARPAPEVLDLELLVTRHHRRREGIEHGHREGPDDRRDDQGRAQELPYRDPGGARHHQFLGAGEARDGEHPSEEHGEGQRFLGQGRQLQERHTEHHAHGGAGPIGGAAQQLDQVEDQDQAGDQHENGADAQEIMAAQVEREGGRETHQPASAARPCAATLRRGLAASR